MAYTNSLRLYRPAFNLKGDKVPTSYWGLVSCLVLTHARSKTLIRLTLKALSVGGAGHVHLVAHFEDLSPIDLLPRLITLHAVQLQGFPQMYISPSLPC